MTPSAHRPQKLAYVAVRGATPSQTKELPILVDGGPLCIAGIRNWSQRLTIEGLYFIYHKVSGFPFGPYFASITLAEKAMKKALKEIPKDIWSHDPEWYGSETWLGKWIHENLGKPMDLIGGEWEKPAK